MPPSLPLMVFMSILFPAKLWFAPGQPIDISVKGANQPISLILTDFTGKVQDAAASNTISADGTVDVAKLYPMLAKAGTYILYAVPKGKTTADFVGTPLLIEIRIDPRRGDPTPVVVRVEPLRY